MALSDTAIPLHMKSIYLVVWRYVYVPTSIVTCLYTCVKGSNKPKMYYIYLHIFTDIIYYPILRLCYDIIISAFNAAKCNCASSLIRYSFLSRASLFHWFPTTLTMSFYHRLGGLPLDRCRSLGYHSVSVYIHRSSSLLTKCPGCIF